MTTTPTTTAQPEEVPPEVYAIFCAGIEQATAQKMVAGLTAAVQAKVVKHVHILFQSAGGLVGDGVFLYNLFRSLPIELTLYNVGQISSAAVIAFLGAKHRKTSSRATFMVHRTTQNPHPATSRNLEHIAKSLALDDERTEAILREHVKFPEEMWAAMHYHDLHLSAQEAVEYGIADEISDFGPPAGTQIFNILAL
jgi:ATP-dependent Clp protease protease subunit